MADATSVDTQSLALAAAKLLSQDPRFKVTETTIRGNSYRIFENGPHTLFDLFQFGAVHGDKDFLYYQDETYSYAGLWQEAQRFAAGLQKTYGISKGDRVAIAMRNYPEWCSAFMAITGLGAIVVPLNAWWKTEELAYALEDSGAKYVVVDGRRKDYLAPVKDRLGLTLILAREEGEADAHYKDIVAAGEATLERPDLNPDDTFAIYYTSGSTGQPKGVVLSHIGCLTTLLSWGLIASMVKEARGGVSLFGDNPGIVLAIPLFHVTGSHSIFLLSYLVGRRIAMMYRWDPKEAVDIINKFELTNFVGVPTQSFELIEAAGEEGLPSLIDIGSGGAKRPPDHVRLLKEKFTHSNPSSGYGLTETNAIGAVASLNDYHKRPDSAGRTVPPCTDIKIVMNDKDCPIGEVGEIWIRSIANMKEYLNKPEETAKSLTPDGWFRTGDLGKFDEDGFLYIVDRIKELIIRGGENISSLEVEARAYEHPGVSEAVVFSVPCDHLGERVGLVFLPKEGEALDPESLRSFMAEELAGFKVPERIWTSPGPLPRLGTAKFDKITIKKMALANPPSLSV